MSKRKLDGMLCEWCDEPAKRSYPIRGQSHVRVYICNGHSKIAYRHATGATSAALGSLADEIEKKAA
jgi:hypothetical protein